MTAQDAQGVRDRLACVAYYYAGQAIMACHAQWGPVSARLDPPHFATGTVTYKHPVDGTDSWNEYQTILKAMWIHRAGLLASGIFWRDVALTPSPPSRSQNGDHAALERLAHALHPESRSDAYKAMIEVDKDVRAMMGEIRITHWLMAAATELGATKVLTHADLERLRR